MRLIAETRRHPRIVFAALCGALLAPASVRAQNPPPTPPSSGGAKPTVITPAGPTAAQAAAGMLGKNASSADISEAIKNSGLNEQQIKSRLQASGYDPKLADPFFGGGGAGTPAAANQQSSAAFLSALQELGIVAPKDPSASSTSVQETDVEGEADKADKEKLTGRGAGGVFGRSLFSGKSSTFDPVVGGPVDASYRVGVGDELQLVLTGEVELANELTVRRDGSVVLPTVGQVQVAGLTLDGARAKLKREMSRVYSGITTGKVVTDLTIAKIRTNVVTIIGEVEKPGQYQVSALGTVFHALTKAGGPTVKGSFRRIEVRRGGVKVREIDLYDYLLLGDASNDIRTEQGDIIFVPLDTRMVAIRGAVRRQGIFELRQSEGFSSLKKFAGGFLPAAATDRIQIDRILPPEQRRPGVDRVVIDIPAVAAVLDTVALFDNDIISVFSIGELRRNTVSIGGQVFEPGPYEWKPGMTMSALVDRAKGFLPWSLTDRVKVERGVPNTGRNEVFSLNMSDSASGKFALNEFDQVTVLDGRLVYPSGSVSIGGEVVTGGERPFVERQTLGDLIDLTGGLKEAAAHVEVVRRKTGRDYSDTTSIVLRYALDANHNISAEARALPLERFDQVFVRTSPGFRSLGAVDVSGLFKFPGTYAIENTQEKMSSIIRRSGGVLPIAYLPGFHVTRAGRTVPIDFKKMMAGDAEHDILLKGGDVLQVEGNPGLVNVGGSVEYPVSVPYNQSWGVSDYLDAAGGYKQEANKKNVIVTYVSGSLKRRRSWHSDPEVLPGSTITVGAKPAEAPGNGEGLTRVMAITTTLVTLLIGYKAISK